MREERDLLERLDVRLLAELLAYDRPISAGIDNESRIDGLAIRQLNDGALRIIELHGRDRSLLANFDALVGGVAQEKEIEFGTADLERAVVLRRQVPIESEGVADFAVAGDEFRSVFRMEFPHFQLGGDAEAVEELVVVGKERFADLEPRKPLALDQQDVETALFEQRSRRRARGPAADHDDVTHEPPCYSRSVSCSRDSDPWRRLRPACRPSSRQPAGR